MRTMTMDRMKGGEGMRKTPMRALCKRAALLMKKKRGATLVEMIVSMLLTAMIMISASASLLAGYYLYQRVQAQNRAVELAVVLCDDIHAEMNKCYGYVYGDPDITLNCASIYHYDIDAGKVLEEPFTLPETYLASSPSDQIDLLCFQGISGNNTCMTVADGRVVLYYPQSAGVTSWTLGNEAYYGLHVTQLNFRWLEKDGGVVLEVKLTLSTAEGDWTYSTTRYVTCENLSFPKKDDLGQYEYKANCCKTVRYQ